MLRVVNATRRRLTEAVNWFLPQQRPEEVDRVAMELRVVFDLWQVANRVFAILSGVDVTLYASVDTVSFHQRHAAHATVTIMTARSSGVKRTQ